MPQKEGSRLKGEYLQAAEQQLAWQRYMAEQGARFGRDMPVEGGGLGADPPWSEVERYYNTQRTGFGLPLFKGDLFYVGPEFCDVLQRAVDALTYDVTVQAPWFPTPVGFVYFHRDMELPDLQTPPPDAKNGLAFRALGWSCLKKGRQVEGGYHAVVVDDPAETEHIMWATFLEYPATGGFIPMSFLSFKPGESLNAVIAEKMEEAEPKDRYREPAQRHELRYAAVLLLLLQQRFLVQRTLALEWDRGTRRRHEREVVTAPDNIKVITFRKEIYSGHATTHHNRDSR